MASNSTYPEHTLHAMVSTINSRTKEYSEKIDKRGGVIAVLGILALGVSGFYFGYKNNPDVFGSKEAEWFVLVCEVAVMFITLSVNNSFKEQRKVVAEDDKATIFKLLTKRDTINIGDEGELGKIKKRHDIGRTLITVASRSKM